MTREEAIQIIKNLPIYRMEQEYDRKSDLMKALKMAVESLATDIYVGSKWIPCSERLPEQNGKYLVTAGEGKFPPRVFEYKNAEKLYWENEIGCKPNVDYVKAWQPLPEPYKEGET